MSIRRTSQSPGLGSSSTRPICSQIGPNGLRSSAKRSSEMYAETSTLPVSRMYGSGRMRPSPRSKVSLADNWGTIMLTLLKSRAALDLRRLDRYELTWTGKGYPRFAIELDRLSGLCQAQGNVKKKLFRVRQRYGTRATIEIRNNLLKSWRSVISKQTTLPHITALAQPNT